MPKSTVPVPAPFLMRQDPKKADAPWAVKQGDRWRFAGELCVQVATLSIGRECTRTTVRAPRCERVLGLPLDRVRERLVGFDRKGYTNPSMMRAALDALAVPYQWKVGRHGLFASYGLARVQWAGPWTKPGVPAAAAYRHTHWVGSAMPDRSVSDPHDVKIFDMNAIGVGGWIDLPEWSTQLVPWLLKQCEPKATGEWWLTHVIEIRRPA
jgi:hypothetical protein